MLLGSLDEAVPSASNAVGPRDMVVRCACVEARKPCATLTNNTPRRRRIPEPYSIHVAISRDGVFDYIIAEGERGQKAALKAYAKLAPIIDGLKLLARRLP